MTGRCSNRYNRQHTPRERAAAASGALSSTGAVILTQRLPTCRTKLGAPGIDGNAVFSDGAVIPYSRHSERYRRRTASTGRLPHSRQASMPPLYAEAPRAALAGLNIAEKALCSRIYRNFTVCRLTRCVITVILKNGKCNYIFREGYS